jgi:hypothetical protein
VEYQQHLSNPVSRRVQLQARIVLDREEVKLRLRKMMGIRPQIEGFLIQ